MILINPLWLLAVIILATPYIYGWLRIEMYAWVQDTFDENVAKAWVMPKYKHYLRYIRIKFFWFLICNTNLPDEEREYAKMVSKDLYTATTLPKYILEADLLSGRHEKIKSLWSWISWEITKKTRHKWRV